MRQFRSLGTARGRIAHLAAYFGRDAASRRFIALLAITDSTLPSPIGFLFPLFPGRLRASGRMAQASMEHLNLWKQRLGNQLTTLTDTVASRTRLDTLDLRWITSLRAPSWLSALEARGGPVYQ